MSTSDRKGGILTSAGRGDPKKILRKPAAMGRIVVRVSDRFSESCVIDCKDERLVL